MTAHPTAPDIEQLAGLLERATPGPWQVQDGCSWRRIGTSEHDGNVLCPTTSRTDSHPDLTAGRGEDCAANLALIVAAVNALPALLIEIATLRAQIAGEGDRVREAVERCAQIADECPIMGVWTPGWLDGASSASRQVAAAIRATLTKEQTSGK